MSDLKTRIIEKVSRGELTKDFAFELIKALQKGKTCGDIAIIGMAGRFPGARNLEEFWENLRNGVCSIGKFPKERRRDTDPFLAGYRQTGAGDMPASDAAENRMGGTDPYLRGGYLDEIDRLDAEFFRVSPKEAQLMDPYQRVFLETAWRAVEDAGYAGGQLRGTKTGLYVGRDFSDGSFYKEIMTEPNPLAVTGLATSVLASRLAYILNLQGPAMIIDTACSSSLVALHLAAEAMRSGEIETAIVGGIALSPNPVAMVGVGVDSPDATVRAFDKGANGTVWGEGAGVVLIKPLEKALRDGDRIYALFKGSAINNDGTSNGLVAPRAETQTDVITRAWEEAGIHPESISYIEAHGTGTQLGDPIEIKGLTDAFKRYTSRKQFCSIGSLKPSIGHLVGASGIASVIKVVLAMLHRELPASLHFTESNPLIDFVDSPLTVNTRLTPWPEGAEPRRAGVTSLGFSGTNCHVLLEAYQEPESASKKRESGADLFTVAAHSEEAIRKLVRTYHEYLSADESESVSLYDLCYSANTGRGQYRFRLAIIAASKAELQRKLLRLAREDFDTVMRTEDGICFGSHRPVGYKERVDGDELSEAERIRLSESAGQAMRELAAPTGADRTARLSELAELYVKGAELHWTDLYRHTSLHKIKIPGYPFERKRHWVTSRPREVFPATGSEEFLEEVSGPLLDQRLEMAEQELYLTGFGVSRHWVLREHRIMGLYIIPGTTYLEMLLEIAAPLRAGREIIVENLTFVTPLAVAADEVKIVQTLVREEGDTLDCTVMSKTGPDEISGRQSWLRHAMGRIRFVPAGTGDRRNPDEIKAGCPEERTIPDGNYQIRDVYEMGPRWRNIRKVYVGVNEVLGYLELDQSYAEDLHSYINHPALMDMAVGVASQVVDNSREYLPFSYKKIHIYANLPRQFYSYAVKKESATEKRETVAFDIVIMDTEGNVLLTIDEYRIKKVNKAEMQARNREPLYHTVHWVTEPLTPGNAFAAEGSILMFKDEYGLADSLAGELRKAGYQVLEVTMGESYAKRADGTYCLGDSAEDYHRLIEDITGEQTVAKILHLAAAHVPAAAGEAELNNAERRGVWSLFHLTKALLQRRLTHPLELILVADHIHAVTGTEAYLKPEQAPFFALGKVAGQEYPKITTRCIDLEEATGVAAILAELTAGNTAGLVAYRGGQRYVEEMCQLDLASVPDRPVEWKEGGVYLITGGTGGLGLAIGRRLASRCPVKLALVNRSAMPPREDWNTILDRGQDSRLTEKITAIREMEAQGSEVICYAADVAGFRDMERVIADLRRRYGRINGIIHAAGLAGEGLLVNKEPNRYREVLAPKVQGTWILDHLTAEDDLDFFILFSSLNAILGGPGQSDYAAANAYMDAFAAQRTGRGKPTLSINWPAWRDTGMAVQYGVNMDGGVFQAIGLTAGLDALEEVMRKDLSRIFIGEINYATLSQLSGQIPIRLSGEITAAMERKKRLRSGAASRVSRAAHNVQIKEGMETLSETDRKVAMIWSAALGLDEVSVDDNFYDLGGDSIVAITMATHLSDAFHIDFPVEEIFNNPTIKGVSQVIPSLTTATKFKKVERRRIQL